MGVNYEPGVRERAISMVDEALGTQPDLTSAVKHVAGLLGLNWQTLRGWYYRAGKSSPTVRSESDLAGEVRKLKRENAELRRANEVLKAASVFFAKELDQPRLK